MRGHRASGSGATGVALGSGARRGGPIVTLSLGFALSSEEHSAPDLVELAVAAEEAGFEFAMISDHFHPWTPIQGQSPFVWGVLGAIAARTRRLHLGTGVTCPIIRTHPAVIAQAAATIAALLSGRFWLGLGTGERLNEHVTGAPWPPADVRTEMLEEAIGVIRQLWAGEEVDHRGRYFTVENATLFSLPETLPPILMAAGGPEAAKSAGSTGDGLIATAPDRELIEAYQVAAGSNLGPRVGQLTVCWAQDEGDAMATAHRWWPNAALHGAVSQELARPDDYAALARGVTVDEVAKVVICGPDPGAYRSAIEEFRKAGFDHVYLHQVGPDQAGFMRFASRELLETVATR
jgi:coenzyme F420-dependent glucose-6-phosphate dehydrogenase